MHLVGSCLAIEAGLGEAKTNVDPKNFHDETGLDFGPRSVYLPWCSLSACLPLTQFPVGQGGCYVNRSPSLSAVDVEYLPNCQIVFVRYKSRGDFLVFQRHAPLVKTRASKPNAVCVQTTHADHQMSPLSIPLFWLLESDLASEATNLEHHIISLPMTFRVLGFKNCHSSPSLLLRRRGR